jgi:hypothetical protein
MRRTIRNSAIIGTVVASACVGTAWSAAAASSSTGDVLRFTSVLTDYTAIPPRGPNDPQQPGDQAVFVAQLSSGGKVVGSAPHHCTAITVDYSLCEAVAILPDGQVSFQTAIGGQNAGSIVNVAISGGTGKYRDAHGVLTIRTDANGNQTWVVDFD